MDKLQRMRMRDMNNEDIFSIYTEYVKVSSLFTMLLSHFSPKLSGLNP